MLGVKASICERCTSASGLGVRPYALRDLPRLRRLFGPEILHRVQRREAAGDRTLPSLWRWIATTFGVLYLIEVGDRRERRIIGFVGLHDIRLGSEARLSVGIFSPADRGRGYGREALGLLLGSLARTGLAPRTTAEVAASNVASLRLFSGMGFTVRRRAEGVIFFERSLDEARRTQAEEVARRKGARPPRPRG